MFLSYCSKDMLTCNTNRKSQILKVSSLVNTRRAISRLFEAAVGRRVKDSKGMNTSRTVAS
jgi:hypothetical protein